MAEQKDMVNIIYRENDLHPSLRGCITKYFFL